MMHAFFALMCLLMAPPAEAMRRAPVKAAPVTLAAVPAAVKLQPVAPLGLTPKALALGEAPTAVAAGALTAPSFEVTALGPAMALSPKALALAPSARLVTIEEVASGMPLLPGERPEPASPEDVAPPAPAKGVGLLALVRKALGVIGDADLPDAGPLGALFDGRK